MKNPPAWRDRRAPDRHTCSLHLVAYRQRQVGRVINCETQHFGTKCLDFEAIVWRHWCVRPRKRSGHEACSPERKTVDDRRRRPTAFAGDIRNECLGHSSGAWTHCSRGALPSREIWAVAEAGNGSAVPPPGRSAWKRENGTDGWA